MKNFTRLRVPACFFIFIFFNEPHKKYEAPQESSGPALIAALKLDQYPEGISVSEATWNKLEKAGGKRVAPFIRNNSKSVIYYKPEDITSNPGMDPDGAYPIAPGADLYCPVDGLVTDRTKPGQIYRVPTGASVIVDEDGYVRPANFIAVSGLVLDYYHYGNVTPPDPNFAKLANARLVTYSLAEVKRKEL